MTRATVITDASFCPRSRAAGWAAWIRIDGSSAPIKRYGEFKVPVANPTEAEMLAAVNGLWIAAQHGVTEALVQTDCLTVVHMLTGQTRNRKLKDAFSQALAKAGVLGLSFSGRHVRGHTDKQDARSYVNRWCDEHAKVGMRKQRRAA